MKDGKTLDRIQLLHPKVRQEADKIYSEIALALTGRAICRFSHTLRTFKEQDDLYAQGRSKPGAKVTNAKGGDSYHNYGLAIDIVLIKDAKVALWDTKSDFDGDGKSDWMECVAIFKKYGWDWGGEWKFVDAPHFQKSFGYSIAKLKELRNRGFLDSKGYVQI
jgi:peptidoglycan L-alanyl-D-glutamate endopeptidase CwlK